MKKIKKKSVKKLSLTKVRAPKVKPVKVSKRKKPVLTQARQVLLSAIWDANGGITKVAQKLGVVKQEPVNWRQRGEVPLKHCVRFSKELNCSPFALNYIDMSTLFGKEKTPEWKDVVRSAGLDSYIVSEILSLPAPRIN